MSDDSAKRVQHASQRARELTLQMWQTDDQERARELFREVRQLHLGIESYAMRVNQQSDN